jgi:outer membrane protein
MLMMMVMKKSILLFFMLFAVSLTMSAQKFALIDMEYILNHIPAYKTGTAQIDKQSDVWQKQVESAMQETQKLYTDYQAKASSMTTAQKQKAEDNIIAKEKSTADLRKKYFGPDGELAKQHEALMKPIQDEVYEAVKNIATADG